MVSVGSRTKGAVVADLTSEELRADPQVASLMVHAAILSLGHHFIGDVPRQLIMHAMCPVCVCL